MTGPGVLFLGGASSYSGATTVEAGTLEIGSASAIPAISAVTISSGSTLNLNGVNPTIGSLSGAGSVSLGSGTLTTGNGSSTGFSGVITGTGGLTIQGSGVFELASANTYSGPTVIDAGATVDALNGSALGKNSAITVATGATLNVSGGSGLLAQYFNLYPNTPNSNNFVSLAALKSSLASDTPYLTNLSSDTSLNNSFDFGSDGSAFPAPFNTNGPSGVGDYEAIYTGTFNAPVSGTYTFDTASDDGSMLFIDGNTVVNNNYFQPITVVSGTVNLTKGPHSIEIGYYQAGYAFGLYADVTIPNGTIERLSDSLLTPPAINLQIGSLSGGGTTNINGSTLTIGSDGTATTFGGTLAGTGNLTKVGSGTFTITGANAYSSGTTVSAGAFIVTGAPEVGLSRLVVAHRLMMK